MQRLSKFLRKHSFWIALFIIFIYAAYVRLLGAVWGSFAFTYDVGRDMLVLYDMVEKGKFTLIGPATGIQGVFHGSWWYYFLAVPFWVTGGSPNGIAAFTGLMGVAVVMLVALFATSLWGRKWGVLAAFFVATSPSFIKLSALIWNPHLMPLFLMLTFILFVYALSKPRLYVMILMGICVGLTFESEVAFGVVFLPSFFIALVVTYYRVARSRLFLLLTAFSAGVGFIFIPRVVFELRHSFIQSQSLIRVFLSGDSGSHSILFFDKISRLFMLFFEQWYTTFGGNNVLLGLVTLGLVLVCFFAIYPRFTKLSKQLLTLLLLTVVPLFVVYLIYPGTVWAYYLIGLPLFYLIFVFIVMRTVVSVYPYLAGFVVAALFVLALVNGKPWKEVGALFSPPFAGDASVFRNQTAVLDYIYRESNGRPFNVISYTPPVMTYTWDYLFLWYGPKHGGYGPVKEKQPIMYVIVEPDYEKPVRREQWLDERRGDGKIVKEATPAGGILVQTRERL